tara:strand:- start:585 stop:968 length:384 start_codon:yes stop_codon:yes gene_type:complete
MIEKLLQQRDELDKVIAEQMALAYILPTPLEQRHRMDVYLERLLYNCFKHCSVTLKELRSKNRSTELVACRHAVIYLLSEKNILSLVDIGKKLNRHHASVIHGKNKVIDFLSQEDESTVELIKLIGE